MSEFRRKRQKKCFHGDYPTYYKQRTVDHRLDFIPRRWFDQKNVLDIGCNNGKLTMKLGSDYCPRVIVGNDISHQLICQAQKNLSTAVFSIVKQAKQGKQGRQEPKLDGFPFIPLAFLMKYGVPSSKIHNLEFPYNVKFRNSDFLQDPLFSLELENASKYDVILALSITKWIHLHNGDQGIMNLFRRVYHLLSENGIFIIEPQPKKSYFKRKNLSPQIQENYKSIRIYPKDFPTILTEEIGFNLVKCIYNPQKCRNGKGFDRPIFACFKGKTDIL